MSRTTRYLLYVSIGLCLQGSVWAKTKPGNPDQVAPATEVETATLFDSHELYAPQGNSALHYIDARLFELRDQGEASLVSLKRALEQDPDSAYLQGELARTFAQNSQYEQAIVAADQALILDPDNPRLHLLRGKLHSVRQRSTLALQAYQRCIALDPESEECYTMSSREYLLQRRPEQAIAILNELLEKKQSIPALYQLGTIYTAQPEFVPKAVSLFRQILVEDPNDVKTLSSLADIYLEQKNYPDGLDMLLRIENLAPQDVPTKLRIGLLYYELQDFEKALDRFAKVLELSPKNNQVLYYLGNLEVRRKNYPQALRYFRSVAPKSEPYPEAAIKTVLVLEESGRRSQAIREAKKILHDQSDVAEMHELLASLYIKKSAYRKAAQVLKAALRRFPQHEKLLFTQGLLLDKQDRFEESMRVMKNLLDRNPQNVQALNYLGYSYADRGIHLPEALDLLQQAYQLKPEDGYIADSLGWAYFKLGRYEEALRLLKRANELSPQEPTILEHLSELHLKTGLTEQAESYLTEALEALSKLERPESKDLEDQTRLKKKLELMRTGHGQVLSE